MDLKLSGKRALVTGSTSGIGIGIARALVAEGAAVIVHGRDRRRAAHVAQSLRELGGRVEVVLGDLSCPDEAASVAASALDLFGGVDILVNNAGGRSGAGGASQWEGATEADWVETFQKNTVAAVRLIRALMDGMKAQGWGRIIQIVSASAAAPNEAVPHYAASKAAMVNMTLGLSRALRHSGVTSNAVSPGMIATPALDQWLDGIALAKAWGNDRARAETFAVEHLVHQSVGRIGQPDDVGAVVAFLASPLADFVNGATFRVDGGCSPAIN